MTTGHITLGKAITTAGLAALFALQPLAGYAQPIGEARRNGDKPLPHVLPIADRADMLPLPYVPPQWSARADAAAQEAQKASVANAISMSMAVSKTSANVGDTVTWTLTVDNLTASPSGALTATATLPANINTIVVTSGSGVTCGTANAGTSFTCNIPTMAANTSNRGVASITAKVTAEAVLTNTATLKNSANATLNCNGAVGNCTVTTQVQDDDDNLLPTIIAALKPRCSVITASPTSTTVNTPITLNATCTFKGNLVKRYAFYRTAQATGLTTYLGDSVPLGAPSFVTSAPATAGVYVYSVLVLNGGISSNAVAGVSVNVTAVAPSGCSISGPIILTGTPAQSDAFTVACTGGSPITGYSWTRNPAAGFTTSTASSISDTPFSGGTPASATYTVVVSNSAGNATANLPVNNSSANIPPKVLSIAAPSAALTINTPGVFTIQATDDKALTAASLAFNAAHTMTGATLLCPGGTTETCTVNWTPTAAGVYTLGLTLTDSQGATTTATSVVAVSEPPNTGVPALPTPQPPAAAVGTTAGQFAVSESGAATYSIPIQVPPGVAGLQPNLALTYNSQGGDGPLGVGWNLSGLSSVTRCPKTIATDGIREPINYDNITDPHTGNDAFCLDGQRLIPVSGSITSVACVFPVGSAATPNNSCTAWEFRTEIESYSRIIGIGDNAVIGTSGSGPTRFRVYAKSGQILEYGSRWWGMGAPRPNNIVSIVPNASFEDLDLSDSCWISGGSVSAGTGTPCNTALNVDTFSGLGDPAGLFKTWNTGASTSGQGWNFWIKASGVGNAGIQQNGSSFSPSTSSAVQTPYGQKTAFIQQQGVAANHLCLDAGSYTLGFRVAGRPFGGNQDIALNVDGTRYSVRKKNADGTLGPLLSYASTTPSSPFQQYVANITVGPTCQWIYFSGQVTLDGTALLDDVTIVPFNEDKYAVKVFPLDRVEDRSGNYMHIDYGGTHEPQNLTNSDGSVTPVSGTLVDSYGTAQVPSILLANRQIALVAQGARPALEMHPRRLTYGMRSTTPGNGNNQASASGVEVARVILNYECIDGSVPVAPTGSCISSSGVNKFYDTGAGQMLLSKRLASILTLVGGSDDSSLASDRADFHYNEANATYTLDGAPTSAQCLNGSQSNCGTLMRRYTLAYDKSLSSGRARLNSVTEWSGDGVPLQPTSFVWQDSAVSLSAANSGNTPTNGQINWNSLYAQGQVADVVGDGRSRMVVRKGPQTLAVCTLDGATFSCVDRAVPAPFYLPDATSVDDNAWTLADVNGDGIADILVTPKNERGSLAFSCFYNTPALVYQCANMPGVTFYTGVQSEGPNPSGKRYYSKTGDFNADGRIDVAFYRGNGWFEVCLAPFGGGSCQLSKINGLNITFQRPDQELEHQFVADFNGDGRADVAYRVADACVTSTQSVNLSGQSCSLQPQTTDSYWSVCFASGPDNAIRFDCATRSGANLFGAVKTVAGKTNKIATYDFNGDGLADMATVVMSGSTVSGWRVCISTGDGEFADRQSDGECRVWTGPTGTVDRTVAGDFNGDGRTDLATWKSGTDWEVCLSTGSGFNCAVGVNGLSTLSGPTEPADCTGSTPCFEAFVGDFLGYGKSGIAVNQKQTVTGVPGTLVYGMPSTVMPDMLSKVTTGLGAVTQVAYEPLSKPNGVYQKAATIGASDPNPGTLASNEIAIQSPMYVVASTLASTGNGSSHYYKSSYAYQNLRADKWGRGLSGFYRRNITDNVIADVNGTIIDDTNAQVTGVINNQTWPHIGRPLVTGKLVKAPNGNFVTVSSTVMSYFVTGTLSGINRTDGAAGQYILWKSFQTKSIQNPLGTDRDLDNTSLLPKVTTYTGIDPATQVADIAMFYDGFSNPRKVVTVTEHPSSGETWTQAVTNNYYDAATGGGDTTRWLLGKLQDATTVTSVSGYTTNGLASFTRKSSFTYQGIAGGSCTGAAPGQLCTETVEPDRAVAGTYSLYQRSAYTYDAFGNRLSSTANFYNDDAGTGGLQTRSTGTTYDFGKYPVENTRYYTGDSNRNLKDIRFYDTAANNPCRMPTLVTDANGNYAKTAYDGFCRKVSEAAYAKGTTAPVKWSTFTLANSTNSLQQPSAAALGFPLTGGESYAQITTTSDGGQSAAFYDNLQRTVRAQTRTFSGTFAEASTVYDALGRKSSVTQPVSSGAGTGTATTNYFYDAMNRVTQEKLPDTNTVDTVYNGLTTTVTRSNSTGSAGNAVARSSSKAVNAKGMVATVTTSPVATAVNYTYDAIGNLTKVVSPGANGGTVTKTMAYDLRGRQTQLVDPDAGTYNYTYNGAGEQRTQTDSRLPTNYVTTTNYDPFGRKTTRTETQAAGGDATTTWSYDCANGKGLLCSVNYSGTGTAGPTNATSKTTTYDQYSRPVTTTTVIAGQTFVSQVAYDGRGRPLYSVYPQATLAAAPLSLKQSYNSYGFASQTEHATTGFVYSTINSRNNDGQVNGTTMGGGLLTHTNGYSGDGLGRIASINITGGTSLTQSFGFESVGNLKSRSLTGGGRSEVESFTYDALDRLLSSGAGVGNVTALPDTGSFGYDSAGNLNSKAGLLMGHATGNNSLCNIGANTACAVRETNLATAAASAVVYDGNGNIQRYLRPLNAAIPGADGATLTLFGYTAFNLPTSVTKSLGGTVQASAEFFYDAGYQRVRQIKRSGAVQTGPFVDDILYVVPGGFELHRNAAGQITSSIATVSGPDGVVATVSTQFDPNTGLPVTQASVTNLSGTTTVTKLLLKDHLGSMVAEFTVTASNAGTLVVHGFGPWGNARNGLNGDQRGFTGHEHLAELGIIHMNGRLYDPVLGRFLQADPIIQAPQNAQSHNRYSYVLNNPLSFTDPSGFSFWTKWRTTVVAIAASIVTAGAASAFVSAYMYAGLLGDVVGAAMQATIATTSNFVGAVAGGFAAGGISGGNIQSALQGAFTAALTFGVGEFSGAHSGGAMSLGQRAGQVAGHAAVGCGSAAMAGGSCRAGAMRAGLSAFAGHVPGVNQTGLLGRIAVGAIASKLGGGKAENGALSAAFQYLFNDLGDKLVNQAKQAEWFGLKGKIFDSGTHEYAVENLACKWGEAGCSVSSVTDAIRTRGGAVPCAFINCGSAAGSWSFIGPVNFVTHREIENGIMNITTPVHGLDGVVTRVAVSTDQGVIVRTWGFGVGPAASLNTNFFSKVWNSVDASIRTQYQNGGH